MNLRWLGADSRKLVSTRASSGYCVRTKDIYGGAWVGVESFISTRRYRNEGTLIAYSTRAPKISHTPQAMRARVSHRGMTHDTKCVTQI